MSIDDRCRMTPAQLRWRCPPIPAPEPADICPAVDTIVGQPRAVEAVALGLAVDSPGYNIYVSGREGTGRRTTVGCLLEQLDDDTTAPSDLCYVYNFAEPERPRLLQLPAGQGRTLREAMHEMLAGLGDALPGLLESDEYEQTVQDLVNQFGKRQQALGSAFEEQLTGAGYALVQIKVGPLVQPAVLPILDGEPTPAARLKALVDEGIMSAERLTQIETDVAHWTAELNKLQKASRSLERELRQEMTRLRHEAVRPAIEGAIEDVVERLGDDGVSAYLAEVQTFLQGQVERFVAQDATPLVPGPLPTSPTRFPELDVNVLVANEPESGKPIVEELHPSYKNLFGSIDRVLDGEGRWTTDFRHIHAGSLLRANGGYLIVNALDALYEPQVYLTLKRTLRHRLLELQTPESMFFGGVETITPEPVPLSIKVVLIGSPELHRLLHEADPDFPEVFKVKADFDWTMPRTEEGTAAFLRVLDRICAENALPVFDDDGRAAALEESARLAGRPDELTVRFRRIADLAREAAHVARREDAETIGRDHVAQAVAGRRRRLDLIECKLRERVLDGTRLIDTEGAVIGQVNGLAVYQTEDHAFGAPTRISATTALGTRGVINIEREAELSGQTHDKGVLILSGFLRSRYARRIPLAVDISICFDQSYGGVDGDSASSTEIYAIISSLADVPLRQDLAVTGSVNQRGEIQAIGGVNVKIEGFFDICQSRGLTGTQGVLIPRANVQDLMLRQEVVDAVAAGQFQVYAVSTIDEGLELLTGRKPGRARKDGSFAKTSLNHAVTARLTEFAETLKAWGRPGPEPAKRRSSRGPR